MMRQTKTCSTCRKNKPIEEFSVDKSRLDGLKTRCKSCVKELRKKLPKLAAMASHRKCPKCGIVKSSTEFGLTVYSKDGLYIYCKPCRSDADKVRYRKERASELARQKERARRRFALDRDVFSLLADRVPKEQRTKFVSDAVGEALRKWSQK